MKYEDDKGEQRRSIAQIFAYTFPLKQCWWWLHKKPDKPASKTEELHVIITSSQQTETPSIYEPVFQVSLNFCYSCFSCYLLVILIFIVEYIA